MASENVKLLSGGTEKKMVTALGAAIHDINKGDDINASIAKHAKAHNLGPHYTDRIVEAYNTSRTLGHIQKSAAEHRANTVPLADKDEVRSLLVTPQPVKAASVSRNPHGIDFYAIQSGLFPQQHAHIKAAAVFPAAAPSSEKKAHWGIFENQQRNVRARLGKVEALLHEKKAELNHEREKLAHGVHEISMQFRRGTAEKFEVVEKRALGTYGPVAKTIMNLVWQKTPHLADQGEKRASAMPTERVVMPSTGIYPVVRTVMEQLSKVAAMASEYAAVEERVTKIVAKIREVGLKKIAEDTLSGPDDSLNELLKMFDGPYNKKDPYNFGLEFNKQYPRTVFESDQPVLTGPNDDVVMPVNAYARQLQGVISGEISPDMPLYPNFTALLENSPDVFHAVTGVSPDDPNALAVAAAESTKYRNPDELNALEAKLQDEGFMLSRYASRPITADERRLMFTPNPGHIGRSARQQMATAAQEAMLKLPSQLIPALTAGGNLASMLTTPVHKVPVEKMPSLIDPKQEANIREVSAKVMLNDMMTNDPVISGYPVEDVLSAFNQAAALAPALSTEPLAMRALIAKILQTGGRLDLAEVKDLARTESDVRENRLLGV